MERIPKQGFFLWWLGMTIQLCLLLVACSERNSFRRGLRETNSTILTELTSNYPAVQMYQLYQRQHEQVVIDNGIVRVTLSSPEGNVVGISYNGVANVLEARNKYGDRGYFDIVWNEPNGESNYLRFDGTKFSVIEANENQVELSFSTTWDPSMPGSIPINIDRRYILRRGSSGLYTYVIFERPAGLPAMEIDQMRFAFKLHKDRFHYMAISDNKQRTMPTPEDTSQGQRLAYREAVVLTNPSNPELRGEVDDKYQYSMENQDNRIHGWISFYSDAPMGFWMITPSNEFRNCGPNKQSLTSHVGPVTLNMLVSTHYAGKEVTMALQEGEPYNKVFGPVFIYLNSPSGGEDPTTLWPDAVQQMLKETKSWPYDFTRSKYFLKSNERGTLTGRLLVQDKYMKGGRYQYADKAYVGLAMPGYVGSWQRESKGYQFWTRADERGYFTIKNVVPGDYDLYAWVPSIFGDYKYDTNITITPGNDLELGDLTFRPPRNGPTIWEIGIPDRSAAEFYVPDPDPLLMNRVLNEKPEEKFRQYGLWARYSDIYPNHDLIYDVSVDDYSKNWFYAQVPRRVPDGTFSPTTWQITFNLPFVLEGDYTLRLALASASSAHLVVRVNNPLATRPHFSTGSIGEDNAIARHGIHGLYWPYSIKLPSHLFVEGKNTIYLRQVKALSPFQGVMYDYIRLERPPDQRT